MRDYYETLQISRESQPKEIKKAYFNLVRQYPPDRYPDQFMKIREAYEVLIDNHARQEYDSISSLPDVVRLYYRGGIQAMEEKNPEQAILCLEEVVRVYPNFTVINSLLGDAYLENENSGKAIRIFEKLVTVEPGNAGFVRRLAHSYSLRGWHHKAIERYHEALKLDEDNLSLWMGLIGSYLEINDLTSAIETLNEGLIISNNKGWDNLTLYCQIIVIDIVTEDYERLEIHLQELKAKAKLHDSKTSNIAWFLALISKKLASAEMYEMASDTAEIASTMLPDDPEIADLKKEISKQASVDKALDKIIYDPAISDNLVWLLEFELYHGDDKFSPEEKAEEFRLEMEVIMELETIRPAVARLKHQYPELYKIKAAFFDQLLNPKKELNLIDTYYKKFKALEKKYPALFDIREEGFDETDDWSDEPFLETYTRSQPKIGRNDPCPCNSGKKYKKCCG